MVFLGLSVLDLGPMYATDVRQTDVRQNHRFMLPPGAWDNEAKAEAVKLTSAGLGKWPRETKDEPGAPKSP